MTRKGTRVYVTGVAGMIGSNTARALLENGLSVVGVDNLWRGTRDNISDKSPVLSKRIRVLESRKSSLISQSPQATSGVLQTRLSLRVS